MNVSVHLVDPKGKSSYISICLSDTVEKKKKELNQEDGIWTYDGGVLKNEKTFESYDIEKDEVIITSQEILGGIKEITILK